MFFFRTGFMKVSSSVTSQLSNQLAKLIIVLIMLVGFIGSDLALAQSNTKSTPNKVQVGTAASEIGEVLDTQGGEEGALADSSVISRAMNAGPVVFMVLFSLVFLSVITWSVAASKWFYLGRLEGTSQKFISSFWDSRSLNDLNSRLSEYPYSPIREVFRNGYAELVRGSQLKEQAYTREMAVKAALENLTRSLTKAKNNERRKMERFLPVLAISASASPFIGLFGTVWGIMNSFEGIARTGSASLAAVAPGISEALIATAFGLAAAIPAVIGYNLAGNKIRNLITKIDGFAADYLNIVERYLVSDRSKGESSSTGTQTPGI